jgi:hypothetical protein
MGAVVIAVVGDIVAVVLAVFVWRLVGARVRGFVERRAMSSTGAHPPTFAKLRVAARLLAGK